MNNNSYWRYTLSLAYIELGLSTYLNSLLLFKRVLSSDKTHTLLVIGSHVSQIVWIPQLLSVIRNT